MKWCIVNKRSGHSLGEYAGRTELAAINAMHREAGYKNVAEAARALNRSVPELVAELGVTKSERPARRKRRA